MKTLKFRRYKETKPDASYISVKIFVNRECLPKDIERAYSLIIKHYRARKFEYVAPTESGCGLKAGINGRIELKRFIDENIYLRSSEDAIAREEESVTKPRYSYAPPTEDAAPVSIKQRRSSIKNLRDLLKGEGNLVVPATQMKEPYAIPNAEIINMAKTNILKLGNYNGMKMIWGYDGRVVLGILIKLKDKQALEEKTRVA